MPPARSGVQARPSLGAASRGQLRSRLMTTLAEYVDAHRIAFTEINDLLAGLDDEQLAVKSLCPEWDAKACIAHTIGVEKALTGWQPDTESLFDFNVVGAFMEEAASMDADAFRTAVREIADARLADLEGRDAGVVDEPSMTPVGPQAYGNFLQIRVFDMWQCTPLRPGPPGPAPMPPPTVS